ncbi:MAG: CocE/NonD family hydrolase [Sinobacteraceae bacterium]|nr:CocE/NonD family hydrolase [Nevskiaceae bacterium]
MPEAEVTADAGYRADGVRRLVVRVPMRDGVHLATDVYLPAGDDSPRVALLERTPYGRRGTNHGDRSRADAVPQSKPEIAAQFVRAGFAYVLQDCRGRFDSDGEFTKYLHEQADGVDTLAWIRAQPWNDGRVATLGLSYGAHVQMALAAAAPPGLAAMFVDSGGFSSAFHSGIRQGGAYELKQLTWALKHARLAPETAADPARAAALAAVDIAAGVRVNPWQRGSSPLAAAPEYEAYVAEQWANESFGPFWQRPELYARGWYAQFPDVPMVHLSSWYDPYARTAIENYTGLVPGRRGPVRLVMGPWTHGQRSVTHAGAVDFGPAATLDGELAPDYVTLRRDWFDRQVRSRDAPDWLAAPVTVFVMGGGSGRRNAEGRLQHGGRWIRSQSWPPAEAAGRTWYLHPDGQLSEAAPQQAAERAWRFDPRDPVPTIGGAIASGAPLMMAGAFDQRETAGLFGARHPGRALAARADVLVFETAPLAADVEVIGPVVARLWVSTSARDTDFTIKLIDLHPPSADWPEGFAMNLTDGILRLRFRDGFETPRPAEPGRVYAIEIEAFPTANRFLAGHRIRLDVSSSNFPHFDVNPNTGVPAGVASEPVVATNRLHFAPGRACELRLSVMPAGSP